MKKLICLCLLIVLFSCKNQESKPKEEGLLLKVRYKPETRYLISTIRGAESTIRYSGQEFALKKLKSMNVQNPTISKARTKTETVLQTEKILEGNKLPVSLKYLKTTDLNGNSEIPDGTMVFGEIQNDRLPVFIAVASNIFNRDQQKQLLEIVNSSFDQFKFPEKRLRIGEQFAMERPVTMPMEGSVINTIITTNYKLLNINNGIAEFEISQTYAMTPQLLDNSFLGSCIGHGRLSFDVENSMIADYYLKSEMIMNKKLDYFEFDLNTINEISQTTQIQK